MPEDHIHLHKLLRIKHEQVDKIESDMEAATGKTGVMNEIRADITNKIDGRLDMLDISSQPSAEEVYNALLNKVKELNDTLYEVVDKPSLKDPDSCEDLLNTAQNLAGEKKGYFLKQERFEELLRKNPPRNVMEELGYDSVDKMLSQENFWELAASLRFAEDEHWMNNAFFEPYKKLRPEDFETRDIKVKVLSPKWIDIAQKFVGNKLHNVSHLKELGLIFVTPYPEEKKGETLQVFSLLLHYFHEIKFYSDLFKYYKTESECAQCVISALRGTVEDFPLEHNSKICWRIIERYLAKKDPSDTRLFEPHVNPEVFHWDGAEEDLEKLAEQHNDLNMSFWHKMNYTGCFFPSEETGEEMMINMNLKDNTISFVKNSDIKVHYYYHQQEALWNEILSRYIGYDKMVKLVKDNFNSGRICLDK